MATEQSENEQKSNQEEAVGKPEKETLHTTDPQEHMEGPISSLIQKTGEGFETEGADKSKDTDE